MIKKLAFSLATLSLVSAGAQAEDEWISLFNGENLDGWSIKSGFATYRVEDGAIVGKTAAGSPNTFLCSNQEFGDFELEFEVKVDDGLNSGCQIRSQLKDPEKGKYGGRVFGPQVEIESSPGQAGYIYGEATGLGWLSPEPQSNDKDVKQHSHMKNGEWNKFRIVAKGARIQTWINGEHVADLTHEDIYESHPKGFIGLQVHGVGDRGPFEVSWRNLRLKKLN